MPQLFCSPQKLSTDIPEALAKLAGGRFPYRQTQDQPWCLWTLAFITIVYHAA